MVAATVIRTRLRAAVSVDAMLGSGGDYATVVTHVRAALAASAAAGTAAGVSGDVAEELPPATVVSIDWEAECALPAELTSPLPDAGSEGAEAELDATAAHTARTASAADAQRTVLLLTGATGFIGAAILRQLAEQRAAWLARAEGDSGGGGGGGRNGAGPPPVVCCLVRVKAQSEACRAALRDDEAKGARERAPSTTAADWNAQAASRPTAQLRKRLQLVQPVAEQLKSGDIFLWWPVTSCCRVSASRRVPSGSWVGA